MIEHLSLKLETKKLETGRGHDNSDWLHQIEGGRFQRREIDILDVLVQQHQTAKVISKYPIRVILKGGPGSGHPGHAGILGHQGGSLPGGSAGISGGSLQEGTNKLEAWAEQRNMALGDAVSNTLGQYKVNLYGFADEDERTKAAAAIFGRNLSHSQVATTFASITGRRAVVIQRGSQKRVRVTEPEGHLPLKRGYEIIYDTSAGPQ